MRASEARAMIGRARAWREAARIEIAETGRQMAALASPEAWETLHALRLRRQHFETMLVVLDAVLEPLEPLGPEPAGERHP